MVNSDDDSTLRPPLGRTLSGSMPPSHRLISVRSSFLLFLLYVPAYSDVDVSQPPFLIFWNAPTRPCLDSHGVAIDLSSYDIIINQNQSFLGPEVMIFYNNQLGLYPYYDQNDEAVNGGLPQNASLGEHLDKVHQDLTTFMADKNFTGVAVVDWEHWRPLWDRNWEGMLLYQQRSLQLLSQWHPNWSFGKLRKVAKRQFEAAAQDFMAATLQLCRQHRPGGLWGFYGFPECYNFENKNSSKKYSGRCPRGEVRRNDQQSWLWNISRALYPHIYLGRELQGSGHVRPFIRHRLQEAIRVSQLPGGAELPVLPYARIVYTHSMDFLTADDLIQTIGQSAAMGATGVILWGNSDYSSSKEDLIQTIGQSAALGAAGVILWGNLDYSSSKEACLAVKSYIDDTLGMYVVNVSSGALLCSQALCTGNGRCVRRDPSSEAQLHLHPGSFSIRKNLRGGGFWLSGQATKMDLLYMDTHFQCRCYPGWRAADCSQRTKP